MERMGNEVETALYLAGTSLITATHGHVGARPVGDSSHRTISNQAPESCS